MNIEDIKSAVRILSEEFSIKKAVLFGSRANSSFTDESDVDLIVEFSKPVTLITLGLLKEKLEEILRIKVDIIHGPLRDSDMIEIDREIEIYVA